MPVPVKTLPLFLGFPSTGAGWFMVWFYVWEHPKVQPAPVWSKRQWFGLKLGLLASITTKVLEAFSLNSVSPGRAAPAGAV